MTFQEDVLGSSEAAPLGPSFDALDPFGFDAVDDEVVSTTRRGLARLAFVATEAAARMRRREYQPDPMAWMLAPRRMFGGRSAIEACLEREACLHAVVLHAADLGVDAEPEALRALIGDDDDGMGEGCVEGAAFRGGLVVPMPTGEMRARVLLGEYAVRSGRRLWTAALVAHGSLGHVHAFEAAVCRSRAEFVSLLAARHGSAVAGARIADGFDPSSPLVEELVAPALADILRQVEVSPDSPLADGLRVSVEQRFAS